MIGDDVTRACDLARETLTAALDLDWQRPAGGLEWTCWETVEHLADCLFTYAAQLAPAKPSITTHVPVGWEYRRDGGPGLSIFADPAEGQAGLVQVFEVGGTMLTVMVDAVPPDRLSFHNYGTSDASGFAAMAVVEVFVHMHDVCTGLGRPWSPPADLCTAALARIFPDVPAAADPWATLLWATGRVALPGRPVRTSWRWDGRPQPQS
ncbi:maleylpyruvate isomerase N-terminal domain-containing protein [Paractinoplanes maris]|uniref:maleylpyruvate isomerase N-terminal domain-containing protein n=1 Tax=Paractinoplanes maris TaxID=1734446 RepID=UPI002021DFFD|nr:maleylpyruvate isomerase N-terminal domain-containing protein [Actinoplanes maris]